MIVPGKLEGSMLLEESTTERGEAKSIMEATPIHPFCKHDLHFLNTGLEPFHGVGVLPMGRPIRTTATLLCWRVTSESGERG